MATPVFCESEAVLLKRARLDGTPSGSQPRAVFDSEVEGARLALYTRLGASRVAEILGTALSSVPTTEAQVTRLAAARLEELLVLQGLRMRLPQVFRDDSASLTTAWNDAPASPTQPREDPELRSLRIQIAELWLTLESYDKAGEGSGTLQVSNIEPTTPPGLVGSKLHPSGSYRGPS